MRTKIVKSTERLRPPNAGLGRPKGSPNRTTAEAREAFTHLLEWSSPKLQTWLEQVAKDDPARALELVAKLAEYVIPRQRQVQAEVSTPTDWNAVRQSLERKMAKWTIADLHRMQANIATRDSTLV